MHRYRHSLCLRRILRCIINLVATILLLTRCGLSRMKLADTPTSLPLTSSPLTVKEQAIVRDEVDSPLRSGRYREQIPVEVLRESMTRIREFQERRTMQVRQTLASYGYQLSKRGPCDLYRDDELIATDLGILWVTVSDTGDDFAFLGIRDDGTEAILVRRGSVERWDYEELLRHAQTAPVFVGNELISVRNDEKPHYRQHFTVWRENEAVYTYTVTNRQPEYPVRLHSWQGQWVLEIDEQVIVDGQSLNEELGYDAILNWRLLDGHPFYFFRRGDDVGVSYDGQVLPYRYDEVVHHQCCSRAQFNIEGNETMVWFHALRDGTWYYVGMGVYEE